MTAKKLPQESTNTITTVCDIEMLGIRRTVLKISPHLKEKDIYHKLNQGKSTFTAFLSVYNYKVIQRTPKSENLIRVVQD